jgi:hypothetical protein
MRMSVSTLKAKLLCLGVGVGLTFLAAGCAREDSPGQAAALADPKPPVPVAVAPDPVPSAQPAEQAAQERVRFRQALARKFDPSQMLTRALPSGDGILHVPNGHVAHAMVAVKNADGTVRGHCLSSSAEVEALMEQTGGSR